MENQNLWAPWRMEYLRNLEASAGASATPQSPEGSPAPAPGTATMVTPGTPTQVPGCFLCDAAKLPMPSEEARKKFILVNDSRGLIMLNLYPYTNGHLLVAVGAHLGDLTDLTPAQRAGLMELTALGESLLRQAIHPQGINIGINLGRCAGAGLPGHLHVHIVPRWSGDVNFMQTVGHVRVIPQALEESYAYLARVLAGMGTV